MKKFLNAVVWVSLLGLAGLSGKEKIPRGFEPIADIEKATASAVEDKKLLVVVVKGADDACPNCVTTLENGEKAVGSGVVKVFARAEALNQGDTTGFPPALKERAAKKFTTGAEVTFLVFSPDGTKLIAEAARKELQSNKDATTEFKKKVTEEKRALK